MWAAPDISKFNEEDQALCNACQEGNAELARQALERGANPSVQFRLALGEVTPLFLCSSKGYIDIAKLLIQCNVNIHKTMDFDGTSCLHHAASNNQSKMCQFLISQGCKVDNRDRLGRTPLMDAAEIGALDCIKVLCEYKCDVNITDKENLIALSYCLDFIDHKSRNLNNGKTNITSSNSNNHTNDNNSNKTNWTNNNNNNNNINTIKTENKDNGGYAGVNLLSGKMDVSDNSDDSNFYESAWILIKNGSDVNTGGKYGNRTFLHYAASKGDLKTCKELIETYKASVKLTDTEGKRASFYAKTNDYNEVATYLSDIERQHDRNCIIL